MNKELIYQDFVKKGFSKIPINQEQKELSNNALEVLKKLFSISESEKSLNASPMVNNYDSGWHVTDTPNKVERWHISSEDIQYNWPKSLLKELHYFSNLIEFARKNVIPILNFIATEIKLQQDDELLKELDNGIIRLRLLHYYPAPVVRFNPHFDSGIATLFVGETEQSLQYEHNQNWEYANSPNSWILGCSHTFGTIASLPCFNHRVAPSSLERYSIAIFFHVKEGKYKTLLQNKY